MSFYQPHLLQANPNLAIYAANMQQKGLQQALGGITGGLDALSKNAAYNEDNAYRNLLAKHINDFQHQGVGTENERINAMRTSDGTDYSNYLANAGNLVHGMDAQRAGSIFNKALQQRSLYAQNQQNLLASHIKQTGQDQATAMNNYINSVGDANKDGFVNYKDLNPTEQTALNGLYGSVSKGLINTANQDQNFIAKNNIQNNYAMKKEDASYKHNLDIAQMNMNAANSRFAQNMTFKENSLKSRQKIAAMNYLNTKVVNINKQLMPYYSIAPSQMTPDMRSKMQMLIQQRDGYLASMKSIYGDLTGASPQTGSQPISQQGGSSLLNIAPQTSLTDKYVQPQVTTRPSIFNQNQPQSAQQPPASAQNAQQGLFGNLNSTPTQQPAQHNVQPAQPSNNIKLASQQDINMPNGTNAQVLKVIEETNKARKNLSEVAKKANYNQFYELVKNGLAEKADKNVKASSHAFIKQDPSVVNNMIKTLQDGLSHMYSVGFDPQIGYTARLYALRQKSKLRNAFAYAKSHRIPIDEAVKKINGILDGVINRNGNMKNPNTNLLSRTYNSAISTGKVVTNAYMDLVGGQEPFKYNNMHPEGTEGTMIDFGKTLMQYVPDYANARYGDGGLHFTAIISNDYAKQMATKALPAIKDYIAKNTDIPSNEITDDIAQEWLYYNLKDPSVGKIDWAGSVSRVFGLGSLNNQVANKEGSFNLRGFLNSLRAQKVK